MERSRNFYKTIRLGYILISVLIGCIAYNSFYEWQEIEALELDNLNSNHREVNRQYYPTEQLRQSNAIKKMTAHTKHRLIVLP